MASYSSVKYSGIADAGLVDKPVAIETGTTIYATASGRYILSASTATTVYLPASANVGDSVTVIVNNGLLTNIINRNGHNIMGLADDLTLNVANASVKLIYVNSTIGWRVS